MGIIDHFLQGHVQSGLEPGESIMGLGMLRHPTVFNIMHIPQRYDDYLAVATDRRLIVFETEGAFTLASPKPRPVARNPQVWRYDELAQITTGAVEGLVIHSGGSGTWIGLMPHAYCGPLSAEQDANDLNFGKSRRYDIYAQIEGIDGQGAFKAQFPQWLADRVNGGAFPMSPQRRAEIEARIAERRAILAAEQARRIQAAAERDAKMKAAWESFKPYLVPTIILLVGLVALPFGALVGMKGLERWGRATDGIDHFEAKIAFLTRDQKSWVNDPKLAPPSDCPEEKLPFFIDVSRPRDDDRTCHNCTERPKARSVPYPGGRSFPRGDMVWDCPAAHSYEYMLKTSKTDLEEQEEKSTDGLLNLIGGGVAALVGIAGLAVGGILASKKRKALRAAASPAATAGPGPALGTPGAPG